jgi:hypothetical protein
MSGEASTEFWTTMRHDLRMIMALSSMHPLSALANVSKATVVFAQRGLLIRRWQRQKDVPATFVADLLYFGWPQVVAMRSGYFAWRAWNVAILTYYEPRSHMANIHGEGWQSHEELRVASLVEIEAKLQTLLHVEGQHEFIKAVVEPLYWDYEAKVWSPQGCL